MKILLAGASGFIGHSLVSALRDSGHEVRRLVRVASDDPESVLWDPAGHVLDPAAVEGIDGIVNLAGENIAAGRWTAARQARILRSRLDATATLVEAMEKQQRRPAVLLNASAVGWYGDRGDEVLTEESATGRGFLPEVCRAWEAQAERATALGVRTTLLRFGTVLGRDGGALAKLLPVFRFGLGGRLGNGRQWMSWISRADAVAVMTAALHDERYVGPLNVVAPEPVTNRVFTQELAHAVHRSTFFPVPARALRMGFGQMADEALLASTRAIPGRLQALGFPFRFSTLNAALAAVI